MSEHIVFDLTDEEIYENWARAESVPPGWYTATITKVEYKNRETGELLRTSGGYVKVDVYYALDDNLGQLRGMILNDATKKKISVQRLLRAIGVPVEAKRYEFSPNKLVGQRVDVKLVHNTSNDHPPRTYVNVDDLAAAGTFAGLMTAPPVAEEEAEEEANGTEATAWK